MLKAIITVCALFPVFAAAASLIRASDWWIRGFDFPRLQFAIMGLLALPAYLWVFAGSLTDYAIVAALSLSTLWQFSRIFPYTRLARKQVLSARHTQQQNRIAILVANVLTPNRRAGDLLQIIKHVNPDVVLTLESDAWWEVQLSELEDTYPQNLKCPQDNLYGMHLYSRLKWSEPQIRYLVEEDIPSMHVKLHLDSGHIVRLHCLHPTPPSPTENASSDERDTELLLVGKTVGQQNQSVIVAGDFNDVAWSDSTRLFQKISRLLDPRIGRGQFSTFNAKHWYMRWPLDHLFHSDDFTLLDIRRLPYFGSDHFPIYVALQHEPPAESHQEAPQADSEDHADANEKIAQGQAK